jgi:hypothetical protein
MSRLSPTFLKIRSSTVGEKLVFQHYLVAFLDLVGQREALRKMSGIPTAPEAENEFIETARNSLGKVLKTRKAFTDFFDGARRAAVDLSTFPPEHHATILAARQTRFTMYGLSDSIVIAVPLGGEDEHCTATNSVELALLAVCGLTVWAFASGIVFRGGVDVGVAAQLGGNEVYGSALERSNRLESEMAEYPRCVVGAELIQFLDLVSAQKPQAPFGAWAKQLAAGCRRMIVQDTDGRHMLDFLGTEVKDKLAASVPCEVVAKAHAFISREYETFQKAGNDKLSSRYFRLLQYSLARKKIWGV